MTEERARYYAEKLAFNLHITFYVVVGELPMKDQRCEQLPPRQQDRHRAGPIAEE